MMSGRQSSAQATVLALAALTAVAGLALPASTSAPGEYPRIHRIRPTVSLQQCERAGGQAQALAPTRTVCVGGIDNGDPVDAQ
jgi:hypothetical protein